MSKLRSAVYSKARKGQEVTVTMVDRDAEHGV